MSRNTSLSFLLLSSVCLLAACGGDDKNANTGQPGAVQCPPGQIYDGRLCQTVNQPGAPAAGTPAAGTPGAPAAGTPAAGTPVGLPGVATTASGPSAAPLDPTAAQAATQLIAPLGAQSAPAGAKPLGSAVAGNFQQGQTLESQFQMTPGKCYTVVGVGLPPVANLDLALVPVLLPGIPAPTLAVDNTVGATSVIGAKNDCIKAMLAAPVKLVMTVSQGSGVAAAQVFEK